MKIPSSILAEARLHAKGATRNEVLRARLLERLLGRPDELWSAQRLAEAALVSAEQVDRELAAALVDSAAGRLGARLGRNVLRRHAQGWSCGPAGVYEHLRVPSAYEVERWVSSGDYPPLDTALAATKTPLPRAAEGAPSLRWLDGVRLSAGAQAWYLSQLFASAFVRQTSGHDAARPVRGGAALVEPALDPDDTVALTRWLLGVKLPPSSRVRVPRTVASLDWLGASVETGELSRSRVLPLMGTDRIQSRRWAFRWGELRSPRHPDLVSDERIEGLWPSRDDATGTVGQWSTWIGEVLERAMIEQRSWQVAQFGEAYLRHPVARVVAEGLVYLMGGLPVVFIDGQPHAFDGPLTLELGGELRVAHPAEGLRAWPVPRATPPFEQREHPVLHADQIPEPPVEPVPNAAWRQRVRALRLISDDQAGGGTQTELWLLGQHRIHITHGGYGSRYGGARPVEQIEVTVRQGGQPPLAYLGAGQRSGWHTLPPSLVSEAGRMLRVLFGLDPLPRWAQPP